MPKRTNEFQELVDIIQRLYAPIGATVTTSKMVETVPDQGTREVDVFVEYSDGERARCIAIEAKDLSRRLDVTQVECYIGKYNSPGGIIVDKVIIVAKSFTKNAQKRAELVGFELHTLNTLEDAVTGLFSKLPGEKGAWWVGEGGPRSLKLSALGANGIKLDDVLLTEGRIVEDATGTLVGIPVNWARYLLDRYLGTAVLETYDRNAGRSVHAIAEINFKDHSIGQHPSKLVPLTKIVFDFGTSAKLPKMTAGVHELKKTPEKSQRIIEEKGEGIDSTIRIAYEEAETPQRIRVDGFSNQIMEITIHLDFDVVFAREQRELEETRKHAANSADTI